MTIVRLKDGDLWVHSPVKLTDEIKKDIEQFGGKVTIINLTYFNLLLTKYSYCLKKIILIL